MKLTLESTTRLVEVRAGVDGEPIEGRIWEGTTGEGIRVVALITRIAVPVEADQRDFARDLERCAEPSVMATQAFPARLVL